MVQPQEGLENHQKAGKLFSVFPSFSPAPIPASAAVCTQSFMSASRFGLPFSFVLRVISASLSRHGQI